MGEVDVERWMTESDCWRDLHIAPGTIQSWRRRGRLVVRGRRGQHALYRAGDLAALRDAPPAAPAVAADAQPVDPNLLTKAQARDRLAIPAGTIARWIARGEIVHRGRRNKAHVFAVEDLLALRARPLGRPPKPRPVVEAVPEPVAVPEEVVEESRPSTPAIRPLVGAAREAAVEEFLAEHPVAPPAVEEPPPPAEVAAPVVVESEAEIAAQQRRAEADGDAEVLACALELVTDAIEGRFTVKPRFCDPLILGRLEEAVTDFRCAVESADLTLDEIRGLV